jgi:hypothetical protein
VPESAPQGWRASVRSAKEGKTEVALVPDGAAPPVPDDHGNPVPVTFRFTVDGKGPPVKTAVIVGTTEPPEVKLHLQVHDEDGQPLKSLPFELKAAGKTVTGETTADGTVQVSFQRAPEAQLTVKGEKDHLFRLQLGKLEKPEEILGAQQRLQSLGYELRASGKLDDATKKALAAFRAQAALPAADGLDAATAKKIDDEYRREMQGD